MSSLHSRLSLLSGFPSSAPSTALEAACERATAAEVPALITGRLEASDGGTKRVCHVPFELYAEKHRGSLAQGGDERPADTGFTLDLVKAYIKE